MKKRSIIGLGLLSGAALIGAACSDAPQSMGNVPGGVDSHFVGTRSDDVWTTSCRAASPSAFHYDGSSWHEIQPPHPGNCADRTSDGQDIVPAGGGSAWFSTRSTLVRIAADGSMQDFTSEVPPGPGFTPRVVGAFGDAVFVLSPNDPNNPNGNQALVSDLYVLRNGHFASAGTVPFIPLGRVHMSSPTAGAVAARTGMIPMDPQMGYSNWARWDGTTLSLPLLPYSDQWVQTNPATSGDFNASFPVDDVWLPNGTEQFNHYDGTSWHAVTVPRPTSPSGQRLDLLTYVHTPSHSLVAIGAVSGAYDLAHDPAGSMLIDATFWAQTWDGAAWVNPRRLGTLQRCAGPNCSGATGPVTASVLNDGTMIVGNALAGDSASYVLDYP